MSLTSIPDRTRDRMPSTPNSTSTAVTDNQHEPDTPPSPLPDTDADGDTPMESETAAGAPTYSTWIYDAPSGTICPHRPSSPSPPSSPVLRPTAMAEASEMAPARIFRAEQIRQRIVSTLTEDLTWRTQYVDATVRYIAAGLPYRYLLPWPLSMRMQAAELGLVHQLETYYQLEDVFDTQLSDRLEAVQCGVAEWALTPSTISPHHRLTTVQTLRAADKASGNDIRTLHRYLDTVETRLSTDLETLERGEQVENQSGDLVTSLPVMLRERVEEDEGLQMRWAELRIRETEAFPFRSERGDWSEREGYSGSKGEGESANSPAWATEGCNW